MRNSEDIMDIIYMIGGLNTFFDFEETTINKEIRNKINRNMNWEIANETKKISFYARGNGQSGNGYFFLNLKAGEAYMPNAAFQQFMSGQEGSNAVTVDQFIRNNEMETYTIAEGQKYRTKMALGTTVSVIQNDAINEKRFKNDFKKTARQIGVLNLLSIIFD